MARRLSALFVALMLVPAAALAWLGWRWLEQDRALEAQRARERQERALQSAERILDDREPEPPDGAVMVVIRPQSVELFPRTRLLYYPFLEALPEAPARLFEPGEEHEFRRQDHGRAIAAFRELARSRDEAVRAGAVVRLARNLRKAGRLDEALEVYQQLAAADAVAVGGVPAALVARRARGALLAEMQRPEGLRREAEALAADLAGGRWRLERGVYLHHAEQAGRWLSGARGPDAQQEALAAAVARLWEKWSTGNEASGRESFQSQTLVWRSTPERMVALVAGPTFGEPRELFQASRPEAVEWTADGTHLLFASGSELWRIPAEGGQPQRLGLKTLFAHPTLSVHPDGRRIAFTGGEQKHEIWVLENFLPELRAGR